MKVTIKEFEKTTGIHFTTNHNAKMAGMISLSTTCKNNAFCQARICKAKESVIRYKELVNLIKKEENRIDRQNKNLESGKKCNLAILRDAKAKREKLIDQLLELNVCICGLCFSDRQHDVFQTMQNVLDENRVKLSERLFEIEELPFLNNAFFRFEAFGDISSVNQARNYIRLAKANKHCNFALWSKNVHFVEMAFDAEGGRPANMQFIQSSSNLNRKDAYISKYATATFTVYDRFHLERHNDVKINCGALQCLSCLKCYTAHNGVIDIAELLK